MSAKPMHLDLVLVDGPNVVVFECKHYAERRRADLTGWIATGGELLAPLSDPKVFATAFLAEYGSAIAWEGSDDLMIDALHVVRLAEEQKPFGPDDVSAWQRDMGLSNQEAADFLGLGLSTWNNYKAGGSVPVPIAMLCRAAQRDPLLMQAHYRPRKPGRPRKSVAA